MDGGGDVVCKGWLRKLPSEKKMRLYASKRCWFILRSGRMGGNPDVLEYYKNDQSKKPLRIIDLNFCEQVDAGLTLTFRKKELKDSFVFDIKTRERTFYLVAETEEDMNKWVHSICQICGFRRAENSTDSLRNTASASHGPPSHGPRSAEAKLSSTNQHLLPEEISLAPLRSSQPTLFMIEPPMSNYAQPPFSTSAPQDHVNFQQCISWRAENARSASFSQGTRASFLMGSGTAVQKLTQDNGQYYINWVSGPVPGFYNLSKPSRHNTEFRDSTCDLSQSLTSHGHTKGSLTGSEINNEDVYTFKMTRNTLCQEFGNLLVDNMDVPATPLSAYQIPRTFMLHKNHNAMAVAAPGDSVIEAPPRPPKPSQAEIPQRGSLQQRPLVGENSRAASTAATISRLNTHPMVDNNQLYRASSCESYKYPQHGGESAARPAESMSYGVSSSMPGKMLIGQSDSTNSEGNYMPMKRVFSTLLAMHQAGDSSQSVFVPMSSGTHHFDPLGYQMTALPVHRGPSQGNEIQPPPVNRNLRPDWKTKPIPLGLRNNTVIDDLPFKSPVTKSWDRAIHTFNSSSSQYYRSISTQSITSMDLRDGEENYISMQNLLSASNIPKGTNIPAPEKCAGSVNYLTLDFQPGSPSSHHKPSTSSITSDEKVDYVQVDKEKTQALQTTMQEWAVMQQSLKPAKSTKPSSPCAEMRGVQRFSSSCSMPPLPAPGNRDEDGKEAYNSGCETESSMHFPNTICSQGRGWADSALAGCSSSSGHSPRTPPSAPRRWRQVVGLGSAPSQRQMEQQRDGNGSCIQDLALPHGAQVEGEAQQRVDEDIDGKAMIMLQLGNMIQDMGLKL
ncbi:GRB2-associated-binding protein 2-like [Rhynchonycteris naso]